MADTKLTPEVAAIIEQSVIKGNLLTLPGTQLERRMYEAVNAALKNAGGKWDRKMRGHIFDADPRLKLQAILQSGVAIDEKKKFQAFYTPPELGEHLAELADVMGETVLEPSAGDGALATACMTAGADEVDCIEINPDSCEKLRRKGFFATEADFLTIPALKKYSRVVMNPPFSKNQDIAHVQHALKWLAPGGLLVSIMPRSMYRERFQRLIAGKDYDIEVLKSGAFKQSGTMVNAIILSIST